MENLKKNKKSKISKMLHKSLYERSFRNRIESLLRRDDVECE